MTQLIAVHTPVNNISSPIFKWQIGACNQGRIERRGHAALNARNENN